MADSSIEVTHLLNRATGGDRSAQDALFRVIEDELRIIAAAYLRREPADPALQTTVLVDEAFVRLVVDKASKNWVNRSQFYRAAAQAMRNILVDCARRRGAEKRGGKQAARDRNWLDRFGTAIDLDEVLTVHESLESLAKCDPRAAQVVELHFFGGRTFRETAAVLDISVRTAKSDWEAARAFLYRKLSRAYDDT